MKGAVQMAGGADRIKWAPKVPQRKIRRLYELEAKGIIDEELIDEVAYALYARCESILTVTEASRGRVKCPVCGNIILRKVLGNGSRDEILECDRCSWRITWGDYHKTYNKKQLHGGNAVEIFRNFVKTLPRAARPQEKMLLIDRLLHEFHTFHKGNSVYYTRPVAANLIEGTMTEVIRFLDELTYGAESPTERRTVKETWRRRLKLRRCRYSTIQIASATAASGKVSQ